MWGQRPISCPCGGGGHAVWVQHQLSWAPGPCGWRTLSSWGQWCWVSSSLWGVPAWGPLSQVAPASPQAASQGASVEPRSPGSWELGRAGLSSGLRGPLARSPCCHQGCLSGPGWTLRGRYEPLCPSLACGLKQYVPSRGAHAADPTIWLRCWPLCWPGYEAASLLP